VLGRSTRSLDGMAQWHLDQLRSALEQRGWRLTQEFPGDDYRVAGSWSLERSPAGRLIIDFEGLDDMKTLPMAESYACSVRGASNSLYFRRKGESGSRQAKRWPEELAAFVASVEHHAV
jgi:hypothetical protein